MVNVKGLTIDDIMNIDPNDLMRLSAKDLRALTNRLVSASNKRIRRLERTDLGRTSPAYISVSKRGGKFSTRGKNVNQLRNEFASAQTFLNFKTSTVKGWNETRADVEQRLGGDMTEYQSKKFWKTYRELEERLGGFLDKTHSGKTNRTSDRIQKMLYQTYNEQSWRKGRKKIEEIMVNRYNELYEEEQESLNEENDNDVFEM